MSVSGEHAVLSLESGKLSLTDLSRTGTFLLNKRGITDVRAELLPITSELANGKGERLVANNSVELWHGAVVRLGAPIKKAAKAGVMTHALLRFRKKRLSLCHTRLDARNKEYVKAAAAALFAEIVPCVEAADVVVATHMSTTVKLLTALALRKKLVTPEWLQFSGVAQTGASSAAPDAAMTGVYRVIPAEAEYVPRVDSCSQYGSQLSQLSLQLPDLRTDRSQLLRSFLVCLVYAEDEQYFSILQGCGATAVRLYESGTRQGTNPDTADEAWMNSFPGDCSVRCVFHDEMNNVKRPKRSFSALQTLGFCWISSAVLATSVLKAVVPASSEMQALAVEKAAPEVEVTSPVPVWGGLQSNSNSNSNSNKNKNNNNNTNTNTNSGSDVSHVSHVGRTSAPRPTSEAAAVAASTDGKAKRCSRKAALIDNGAEESPSSKRMRKDHVIEAGSGAGGSANGGAGGAGTAGAEIPSPPSRASPNLPKLPPVPPAATVNAITPATAAAMKIEEDVGHGDWETNSERPPTVEALEAIAAAREVELAPCPASATKRAAALAIEMQELPLVPVVSKLELAATAKSKAGLRPRATAAAKGGTKAAQEGDAWDFDDAGPAGGDQVEGRKQGMGGRETSASSSWQKHAHAESSVGGAVSDSSDDDSVGAGAQSSGADGWLTALTGKHARKVLRTKQRQYVEVRLAARLAASADRDGDGDGDAGNDGNDASLSDEELEDLQPVTYVVDFPAVHANSRSRQHGQAATSKTAAAATNARDQRKFRKNFIRVALPGTVISARDMDQHCMAREGERAAAELEAAELEAEEEAAQHKFNEEIFADRFSVKPPPVSRLRL